MFCVVRKRNIKAHLTLFKKNPTPQQITPLLVGSGESMLGRM